ncbi:MAG: SCO family protein [Magnetococcales bacterium]|nr:SCO family protein [Magnetococcales bacterium]
MSRRKLVLLPIALSLLFLAIHLREWWWPAAIPPPPTETAADGALIPTRNLVDFHLTDQEGKDFTLADFRDRWTLIFCGYTNCPDVCPTTLGLMGEALALLERMPGPPGNIQGLFLSVDPKRDTLERIREYTGYFHPRLRGATGTPEEIAGFTRQLGATFLIKPPETPDNPDDYAVTHGSSVYFVDPQGRLRDLLPAPREPSEIVERLRQLKAFAGKE